MPRERIEIFALLAEIVGALAVVVSVIYLAMEISDNTSELQSQGHFHALSLAQRPLELLIADRELADIVEAGYTAPEQLSATDWHRFSMYQIMAFNAWEYLYYANRSGSIPKNLWAGADAYYRELIRKKPALQRFWSDYEHSFDEPFNSYVDETFVLESGEDLRRAAVRDAVRAIPRQSDPAAS